MEANETKMSVEASGERESRSHHKVGQNNGCTRGSRPSGRSAGRASARRTSAAAASGSRARAVRARRPPPPPPPPPRRDTLMFGGRGAPNPGRAAPPLPPPRRGRAPDRDSSVVKNAPPPLHRAAVTSPNPDTRVPRSRVRVTRPRPRATHARSQSFVASPHAPHRPPPPSTRCDRWWCHLTLCVPRCDRWSCHLTLCVP